MPAPLPAQPESTAVRVALWRALHVEIDAPPHVLNDPIGLRLVDPPADWRTRGDMHPQGTAPFRASIVARARCVEDHLGEAIAQGVGQYVILGAGLDTLVQRRPDLETRLTVFEVDQPGPQVWKRARLTELGYGVPAHLRLVPVDFEAGGTWWDGIRNAGFASDKPALVSSLGVSMYLTREAIVATLAQAARFASGSTFIMSFLLPVECADPELRSGIERAVEGAKRSGTPFISFFRPEQVLQLAREAGFRRVSHISAEALGERYFAGRPDGLKPPRNAEELLVATT